MSLGITIKIDGDFSKTKSYLERIRKKLKFTNLDKYGQRGVEALRSATPVNSGATANSWGYTIERNNTSAKIIFTNSHSIGTDAPLAILLQYGHGTKNGGWVAGRDYINPAIQPIFDEIANDAWKEVTKI